MQPLEDDDHESFVLPPLRMATIFSAPSLHAESSLQKRIVAGIGITPGGDGAGYVTSSRSSAARGFPQTKHAPAATSLSLTVPLPARP